MAAIQVGSRRDGGAERCYGLEDGVSILISWTMLVTILIYIYPLKVVFDAMWYFLSGHRVGQAIEARTIEQARQLFAVYALGFVAIALEVMLLNLRAWHLRVPLRLNERERAIALSEIGGWSIPVGVGLTSLVLALTMPPNRIAWSGWVYFSLAILMRLYSRFIRRRARLLQD
jgi:hypothetical protein